MTQLQLLTDWYGIILNVICWSSFVFPILLATYWPWHESDWGKVLISLDLCVGLAVLSSTIRHDWGFPSSLFYESAWLTVLSLTAIPVIGIWRGVMIWRKQRQAALAELVREVEQEPSEPTQEWER